MEQVPHRVSPLPVLWASNNLSPRMSFDPEQVRAAWREYRRSKGDVDQPAGGRPARRLRINHRLSDSGEVHPSPRLLPVRAPVESVSSRASLDFSPQSTRAAALEELARTREVADRVGDGSWQDREGWGGSFPPVGAGLLPGQEALHAPPGDAGADGAPRTLGELAGCEAGVASLRDGVEAASWSSGWSMDSTGEEKDEREGRGGREELDDAFVDEEAVRGPGMPGMPGMGARPQVAQPGAAGRGRLQGGQSRAGPPAQAGQRLRRSLYG